jgi:hypothetical protein
MNDQRRREPVSVWLQVLVLIVLFFGGGSFGVWLAVRLAPESILAQFVGLFSFSFPFAVGLQLWLGAAILIEIWRLIGRRGRRLPPEERSATPPGAFVFVPTCGLYITASGLLIGLFGSSLGVMATTVLYLLLGVGYGVACWLFARAGYLPVPQEP